MDKQALSLAQLKDIHLPRPISWWPPAPGWFVLLFLIIVLISSLSYIVYKKIRNAKPKKEALRLLTTYKTAYEKEHNSQIASAEISKLLKRVSLTYFPRSEVASLHGEAWVDFLTKTSHGIDFESIKPLLLDAPFKTAQALDLLPLFIAATRWIKQRRKPCSN